jgi:hypothetical protein
MSKIFLIYYKKIWLTLSCVWLQMNKTRANIIRISFISSQLKYKCGCELKIWVYVWFVIIKLVLIQFVDSLKLVKQLYYSRDNFVIVNSQFELINLLQTISPQFHFDSNAQFVFNLARGVNGYSTDRVEIFSLSYPC